MFLVVWWLELRPGREPHPSSSRQSALFNFKSEQVRTLAIIRGPQRLELSRTGTGWQIVIPEPGSADALRVDQLARALAELIPDRQLGASEQPLDIYGLEPPSLIVDVGLERETWHLYIGKPTIDRGGYFARVDQLRTVYVISATLVDQQLIAALERPPRATPIPSPAATP